MNPRRLAPLLASGLLLLLVGPAGATPFGASLSLSLGAFGTLPFTGAGAGTSTAALVAVPGGIAGLDGSTTFPVIGNDRAARWGGER
jgi:hypothetical protein